MKTKRIEIRVSEEFYNLLEEICKQLKCTKTTYIAERCLSADYSVWELEYDKLEIFPLIAKMSNNMNQLARSMNSIEKIANEQADVELYLQNQNWKAMRESFDEMRQWQRELEMLLSKKGWEVYRLIRKREILDIVQEYLEKEDPDYLEELRYYDGTVDNGDEVGD
ncbi:plasmid mobilization protein [Faecalicoccus acidiformans]|uniref:Plasmid mobilization relaxosome protein MobC n=1 Tax=Faecalicoccus acidiformans TaxID=915173 RepID=A0ABS2FNQ5_9FIRM|nr:hypothetical protein [Faecalicoccus acidiformans]MBM6831010.1 hypothetical protein [Faecalicoccus acidiformans]